MTEILHIVEGRPAMIKYQGWTEFISIRDTFYLNQKKEWRRRLAEAHPDRHPTRPKLSSRTFRSLMARFRAWKEEERKWYWVRGLMPPDWRGKEMVPPPTMRQAESGTWLHIQGGRFAILRTGANVEEENRSDRDVVRRVAGLPPGNAPEDGNGGSSGSAAVL